MNEKCIKYITPIILRAVRTFAQSLLSMITVGVTLQEINWVNALNVSVLAAIYSILMSIVVTIPENKFDGIVSFDEKNKELIAKINDNTDKNKKSLHLEIK